MKITSGRDSHPAFYYRPGMILVILSLLLTSCKLAAPSSSKTTQPAPDAIFTAAAQTAEARRMDRLTQTAVQAAQASPKVPTQALAETPVIVPDAEVTAIPPLTETLTIPVTPTLPLTTTVVAPSTDAAVAPEQDKAEFIEDVNVPDGTKFPPGKKFQKTWRVENIGKTIWTTQYALVFIDGSLMGASPVVALPQKVSPWEKVNLTVDMVAPDNPGKYTGYWKLRNADGKVFGFGESRNEAIWVQIDVESALASAEVTSTVTSTQTVNAVSLSVDNPVVSGCPHTFIFAALISLNKAATVTYSLEGGDNTGTPIKMPLPVTHNLDAGAHPVIYELTFSNSITGWARLRITQPEQVISNQVNFSLTCG